MNDDVLCVIPARLGSKGVPRKNLRVVAGKTLLERALDFAHEVSPHVVVTTESQEVFEHVAEYERARGKMTGRIVVEDRDLHKDDSRGVDVWRHAWRAVEAAELRAYTRSVYLEPTSPLREHGMVEEALRFLEDDDVRMVWTVEEVPTKYHEARQFSYGSDKVHRLLTTQVNVPRQFFGRRYVRNGAVYAAKGTMTSIYAPNMTAAVLTPPLVNIDTEEDMREAERRLTERGY